MLERVERPPEKWNKRSSTAGRWVSSTQVRRDFGGAIWLQGSAEGVWMADELQRYAPPLAETRSICERRCQLPPTHPLPMPFFFLRFLLLAAPTLRPFCAPCSPLLVTPSLLLVPRKILRPWGWAKAEEQPRVQSDDAEERALALGRRWRRWSSLVLRYGIEVPISGLDTSSRS
jgi:hypothetical protein